MTVVRVPKCPHCFRMEEEIRFLKRELGIRQRDGEIGALMTRLRLSRLQAILVLDLYMANGKFVAGRALKMHLAEDTLDDTLKTHISHIRKKIGRELIEGIYGHGYRLSVPGWARVHAALRPPEMQEPRGNFSGAGEAEIFAGPS